MPPRMSVPGPYWSCPFRALKVNHHPVSRALTHRPEGALLEVEVGSPAPRLGKG